MEQKTSKNFKCGFGVLCPRVSRNYSSSDIIKYDYVKEVELKDPKKPSEFIIYKKKVESSRVNRQDFIQSFADDVGILNILQKVAKTGDVSLLNQVEIGKTDVDLSKMPSSIGAAHLMAKNSDKIYSKVPKDLKVNKTKEDFVNSVDNDFINKYLEEKINKIIESKSKKKEDLNNG